MTITFTVTGAVLAEAVAWVSRATPAKPTIPVLSGLLLDTSDEYGLTLSGYDYETRMSATVDATVTNAGKALVSARLLAAVAKTVNRNVNVTITDEDGRLKVICGRSEWALPALPVEDYPALPEPGEPIGTVNGDALRATIARTLYAVGRDDTLPMLTGVKIESADDRLTLAGTDRFRLVAAELAWTRKTDADVALLVPGRLLDAAARGIGSGEVTLTSDEHGFGMVTGDRVVTGRMLAAEFPRWRALVPEPSENFAELVAAELSAVTDQAQALAAVEAEHTLSFRFADGEVSVSGTGDEGRAAHAVCAAELTGEPIELSMNGGYVRDALSGAGTERVRLYFTSPTRPVLVLAVGDPAFRSIVMPIRTPK